MDLAAKRLLLRLSRVTSAPMLLDTGTTSGVAAVLYIEKVPGKRETEDRETVGETEAGISGW